MKTNDSLTLMVIFLLLIAGFVGQCNMQRRADSRFAALCEINKAISDNVGKNIALDAQGIEIDTAIIARLDALDRRVTELEARKLEPVPPPIPMPTIPIQPFHWNPSPIYTNWYYPVTNYLFQTNGLILCTETNYHAIQVVNRTNSLTYLWDADENDRRRCHEDMNYIYCEGGTNDAKRRMMMRDGKWYEVKEVKE